MCDEQLTKLLQWISEVEEKLASQDVVKEDIEELRNQINIMKVILFKKIIPYCLHSFLVIIFSFIL